MSRVTTLPAETRGAAAASHSRLAVASAIGTAQILAWGSSYYLLAVLAGPITADTGWPLTWIMGALSIGMLASAFTLAAVIMTVISVHLLALLQSQGLALAAAVALGTLIGPSQVGARVLEMLFGRQAHPIWSLVASSFLVAVGLGMLVGAPGVAAAGIVMYGMGSGIRSIARGTVPLALFGNAGYAVLMGRIAMPTLIAQAASPFLGAWLLDRFGAHITLAVLCAASVLNILMVLALLPAVRNSAWEEQRSVT
ncbi:MAG TPA: hypothetical protein VNZ61_23915 [Roseomonas sp.]|nr:hypothetical protein [Roseomonas sp.]